MPTPAPSPSAGRAGRIAADALLALGLLCLEVPVFLYAFLRMVFQDSTNSPDTLSDWVPVAVFGGFGALALLVAVLAGRARLWITAVLHGLPAALLLLAATSGALSG